MVRVAVEERSTHFQSSCSDGAAGLRRNVSSEENTVSTCTRSSVVRLDMTATWRSIAGKNPDTATRTAYSPGLRRSVKNAPCWLELSCATVRPASSEISQTLAPICGVPEGSRTTPEIVPKPCLAAAGVTHTTTAIKTQPRARQFDFMGTGYLPVAPLSATFTAGGVTVNSAV